MKTLTIDIPEDKISEVLIYLHEMGVEVHKPNFEYLDDLSKENYKKHFLYKANVNSKVNIKATKTTAYLFASPANAKRLLKSIDDYENGLGSEKSLIEV